MSSPTDYYVQQRAASLALAETVDHWSCCPPRPMDVVEYNRQNKLAHQRLLAKRKAAATTESEVRG